MEIIFTSRPSIEYNNLHALGRLYFQRFLTPYFLVYSFGIRLLGICMPQKTFFCMSTSALDIHSYNCSSSVVDFFSSSKAFLTFSSANWISLVLSIYFTFQIR